MGTRSACDERHLRSRKARDEPGFAQMPPRSNRRRPPFPTAADGESIDAHRAARCCPACRLNPAWQDTNEVAAAMVDVWIDGA
jgi:hypothetical protein